jgi:hypothetical protein
MVIVYGHKNYLIGDTDKNKKKGKINLNNNYTNNQSIGHSNNQLNKNNKLSIYRE